MKVYKVLDGTRTHYQDFSYFPYLPKGKRPGKWLPRLNVECLGICYWGYHACSIGQLPAWLDENERIFECETKGASLSQGDKRCFQQIRLLREVTNDRAWLTRLINTPRPQGIVDDGWKDWWDCGMEVARTMRDRLPAAKED